MALGDDYATLTELKSEFDIGDADDDTELLLSLSAATTWVTGYCQRDFNAAGAATARVFYPDHSCIVNVDDISTTTGLIVKTDSGDDGTYETTWSASDYQLEPLNQVVAGVTGWPYTRIRAVDLQRFPSSSHHAPVQVTANWGWPSVPSTVKKATLIMAARFYKRRFSPEGVLGGFDAFGPVRVGSRTDPDVEALLLPYRKHPFGFA